MRAIKAKDLTISVPNYGCDKKCPYCISRITGPAPTNKGRMLRNIRKVQHLAHAAQVTTVLFTSKGEPLLNNRSMGDMMALAEYFKDFPLEIQTNGLRLLRDLEKGELDETCVLLYSAGFNTIAVSVDEDDWEDVVKSGRFDEVFKTITETDMNVRLCINITSGFSGMTFSGIWENDLKAVRPYISQVLFRKIDMPSFLDDSSEEARKVVDWIKNSASDGTYERLRDEGLKYLLDHGRFVKEVHDGEYSYLENVPVKILPDGSPVFDLEGIAITFSDYCIQETHSSDDIRSIILMEDGKVYTSWNSKASLMF